MKLFLEAVSDTATPPVKSTTHAACFDVHADFDGRVITFYAPDSVWQLSGYKYDTITIDPSYTVLIPTGYCMQCPEGYSIKFYPRSGLGIKQGLVLANGTGVIDHDYKDECLVALTNTRDKPVTIHQGDRICQMEIQKVEPIELEVVTALPAVVSNRTGGLGSTGK